VANTARACSRASARVPPCRSAILVLGVDRRADDRRGQDVDVAT
jgi:hypothetical protein